MLPPRSEKQAAAFDAIGERYDEAFAHKTDQEVATRWLVGVLPPGARFERRDLTDPTLPADHFQVVTAFFSLPARPL